MYFINDIIEHMDIRIYFYNNLFERLFIITNITLGVIFVIILFFQINYYKNNIINIINTNKYNLFLINKINYIYLYLLKNIEMKHNNISLLLLTCFSVILYLNVGGLFPNSFAITGQFWITFTFSFIFFIGFTIFGIQKHQIKFKNLFIPSGLPQSLLWFIIIIEIFSYSSRLISLSVRLFANIMAGHSLIQILNSFVFVLFKFKAKIINKFFVCIPLVLICFISVLEIGVACLQAYVFFILLTIYLKDVIYLH